MSNIFGVLGAADTDLLFNGTIGNESIFEAATRWLKERQAELDAALSVFVDSDTENMQERFKLPGGGRMQETAEDKTQPDATKAIGQWDVGFPLWNYSDAIVAGNVSKAYMEAREFSRHVESINIRNINTVRFRTLQRLFNNTQYTFTDPRLGTTAVEPLANGDTVLYPPVTGSESEATEDAYTGTNFAAITDANDPYATAVEYFNSHFGRDTGNMNVATFINNAQAAATRALAAFNPVPDSFIMVGDDTDVPQRLPSVPGQVIGRHDNGTWIIIWDWIPASYFLSVHLEEDAALKRRIDMSLSGLGPGLQLVASGSDVTHWPLEGDIWRHRFGYGTGNRLNGRVQFLVASTVYTIPAAYTPIP